MKKNQSFEERAALLRSEDRRYRSLGSVHQNKCKVYKRRWYILTIFSIVAALNNLIWNTWGPIQGTSQVVFGWDNTTITLLADWGPISFVVAVVPMCWLMDMKGLRVAVLVAIFCEFIGSGLRCIPLSDQHVNLQTALIHCGQFITGIGGPIAMAAAPMVSAAWFPPEQRTTATAISSLACYSGTALSFVIGPLLVPDVEEYFKQSELNVTSNGQISYLELRNHFNQTEIDYFKHKIMHLMYIELGITALTMLCVIIHFPEKPKLPPSVTAAIGRLEFKVGAKSLLKNSQFWLLVVIYGIGTGVYGGWCSILDLNLSQFDIDQKTAGWLGFGAVVAGSVSGISLSIFADHFTRYMKLIVIALLTGATASLSIFTLICAGVIPYSKLVLFITSILGGLFVNGTIPLFFELAVESTYPVAEGITSGFLTFSNNFLQIVFYIFPMLPHFGLKWINWCTFVTTGLCIPLLMLWKQRRYRSDVDAKDSYVPAPHNKELSTEVNYGSGSVSSSVNGFLPGSSAQTHSYGTSSYPSVA
ncbi:disrupted in renal carcinoma protein 2 homolog isoform X2 [Orbicella faveolata]|uniref:disrupted in renal carcinoma protein 2 homolog isoform X1 n=1 Tax=Orbicella faveolata TaxID=48498 RepID=UPI0009E41D72|nr:disrupted in renal carcinoma protein 2 homolog isoform X1 [Orbicella faveolata]XP_020625239.1 disrupted in renal carcinoma protein 2 homolog isoform X2 [Orbicella faveolata]